MRSATGVTREHARAACRRRRRGLLVLGLLLPGPLVSPPATAASAPPLPESTRQESPLQVEDLLREGRARLAQGRVDEALELFVRAHVLDGESRSSLVWVLRAWIAMGRINDAFDRAQAELESGPPEPGIDYVIGMAFHARGRDHLASGVPLPTARRNFESAATYLDQALAADPDRFPDAWAALGESRWILQDVLAAEVAAERAVAVDPDDPASHYLLGQVRFTLHLEAERGGAAERGARLWEAARLSYERALELLAEPAVPADRTLRARADLALAHLLLWRDGASRAVELVVDALAQDPGAVDHGGLHGLVEKERLSAAQLEQALERGLAAHAARVGEDSPADAPTHWWLGYLLYERGRASGDAATLERAEEHLLTSVRKAPEFHNAWYLAGRACYRRGDHGGLVEAWRGLWAVEPASLIALLDEERELSGALLDWVVGWCAREQRPVDAAFLCEVRVEFDPRDWEHWNDLGLFSRDAGRAVAEGDPERALALWERALAAYARGYELAPHLPHLLNDRAVVLQYDLERDLDEARRLYEAARDQARELLATGELEPADRELVSKALEDALANLAALG